MEIVTLTAFLSPFLPTLLRLGGKAVATRLKTVEIPVPSIAKQHTIVSKVDELIAFCDELEAQISNIQIGSYQLLESLINRTL
jgi:hypothetical protein